VLAINTPPRRQPVQRVGRACSSEIRGAGFIVPFFFVYSPALLFDGPWTDILQAVVTGSIRW
jgi:hypothetical protein